MIYTKHTKYYLKNIRYNYFHSFSFFLLILGFLYFFSDKLNNASYCFISFFFFISNFLFCFFRVKLFKLDYNTIIYYSSSKFSF